MKVTATKEFTFDCAHMLTGHEGLCQNLHGHTYKLLVTAESCGDDLIPEGPSKGMVCDFKDLKSMVKEVIVDQMDHAYVYNMYADEDSVEAQIAVVLETAGRKTVAVDYRPTAENMVNDFMKALNNYLTQIGERYFITRIRLYETPTSYAEASYDLTTLDKVALDPFRNDKTGRHKCEGGCACKEI